MDRAVWAAAERLVARGTVATSTAVAAAIGVPAWECWCSRLRGRRLGRAWPEVPVPDLDRQARLAHIASQQHGVRVRRVAVRCESRRSRRDPPRPTHLTCRACGAVKRLKHFGYRVDCPFNRDTICKACVRGRDASYNALRRERRQAIREGVARA